MLILILFVTINFYGWDEEDKIDRLDLVNIIDNFIFDFTVFSPVGTYSPEFVLSNAYLINDDIILCIKANIMNTLDYTNAFNNTSYDNLGEIIYKNTVDSYKWSAINNSLYAYLGYNLTDSAAVNFMLGGGTHIDELSETKNDYELNYTGGLLNITDWELNGNKRSGNTSSGYGFLEAGIGFRFTEGLIGAPVFSSIKGYDIISFNINGTGLSESVVVLNTNGILNSGFDGNGVSYLEDKYYFQNNTAGEIRNRVQNNEQFTYFRVANEIYSDMELDLHRVVPALTGFNRFRLIPGFGFKIGYRNFSESFDERLTEYNADYAGHVSGDYNIQKTTYNYTYDLNLDINVPFFIEIRPISQVQMKFGYIFNMSAYFNQYTAQYSEDHVINGANQSFTDPLITVNYNSFIFDHEISVQFRVEFPKVVRLTLGADYNIYHGIANSSIKIPDNIRRYTDGTTGNANYSSPTDPIQNTINFDPNSGAPFIPLNTATFLQQATPKLELDFELVEDYFTLTVIWNPVISWDWANPTNEMVTATNIMNLANWEISAVVKFNPVNISQTVDNSSAPLTIEQPEVIIETENNED